MKIGRDKMYTLYKIDAREWIRKTIEKMDNSETDSSSEWNRFWEEIYFELGGKSACSACKGCPKKAGYTLWYLGRIKDPTEKEWKCLLMR